MSITRIMFWCVLLGSLILCSPNRSHGEIWRDLLSFEGKDLQALDRTSQRRFIHLVQAVLPEYEDRLYIPYCVGRFDSQGDLSRFVLAEGQPLFMIPGESRARIHLFDMKGRHLSSTVFSTGRRIDLDGARITEDSSFGSSLVEISSHSVIGGDDVSRQFYGLVGNDVVLVRLEDSRGRRVRNDYGFEKLPWEQ